MTTTSTGMPRRLLLLAILLMFGTWAPLFSVPPLETTLAQVLAITNFQASLLFSGPILTLAIMAIPAGILADKIGIKKVAGIGGIVIFAGSALRGLGTGYTSLVVFSLILGVGMGWSFATLPKLARAYSGSGQTFRVMSIMNGAGLMLGIACGLAFSVPVLYPITNSYHGVFLIWSVPALVATLLWWSLVREPLCPGLSTAPVGAVAKASPRDALCNKTLWLLAGLFYLHNYFFYSWTFSIPSYLTHHGYTRSAAGLAASVTVWTSIPTVILVPLVLARAQVPRRVFLWLPSLIFTFLAVGIMYIVTSPVWILVALSGVCNVLRFNVLLTIPVELLPPSQSGAASGVTLAVGYLGAVSGPAVAGAILDVTGGDHGVIFAILAVLSSITTALSFLVPRNFLHR